MNKPRLPLASAPGKICLLRLSALGDVSHALPVVRAIQAQWPETEITWICGKFEYKLLRLIEGVRFIVFDKKAGFSEYFRLRKQLSGERFDVLLHMQVAARANLASLAICADIRLGWDTERSRDLHQLFINQRIEAVARQHQVQGFLSFARALGLRAEQPEWNFPVTDAAKEFADQYIDGQRRVMVISACSSHVLRNWTVEGYAALADYAVSEHNMQVILSGGPSEVELKMAAEIESAMYQPVLNLVGKDTLEQLAGLLSRASVVVSPDSGPAHLANALGTPVLGLYACTWSRRSGPYGSLAVSVDCFEEAARKYRNTTADQLPWGTRIEENGVMELIHLGDVKQALDRILDSAT